VVVAVVLLFVYVVVIASVVYMLFGIVEGTVVVWGWGLYGVPCG
jgi:nitric oxide reductase large subunit